MPPRSGCRHTGSSWLLPLITRARSGRAWSLGFIDLFLWLRRQRLPSTGRRRRRRRSRCDLALREPGVNDAGGRPGGVAVAKQRREIRSGSRRSTGFLGSLKVVGRSRRTMKPDKSSDLSVIKRIGSCWRPGIVIPVVPRGVRVAALAGGRAWLVQQGGCGPCLPCRRPAGRFLRCWRRCRPGAVPRHTWRSSQRRCSSTEHAQIGHGLCKTQLTARTLSLEDAWLTGEPYIRRSI